MRDGMIVTQGDANNVPDEPISQDAVKGKMILSVAHVRPIVDFVRSPVGTILFIGAAILLLMFSSDREKKKDQDTLDQIRAEIEKLKGDAQSTSPGDPPEKE